MLDYAEEGLKKGWPSVLAGVDPLTPKDLCDAAARGDELALLTVRRVARYIGIAVANLINVLSPDVIAIGGGISAAGDPLLDPIVASARMAALEGMFEHTEIRLAGLGNDAGVIGAACLVL